jgi:hypothetical protein
MLGQYGRVNCRCWDFEVDVRSNYQLQYICGGAECVLSKSHGCELSVYTPVCHRRNIAIDSRDSCDWLRSACPITGLRTISKSPTLSDEIHDIVIIVLLLPPFVHSKLLPGLYIYIQDGRRYY